MGQSYSNNRTQQGVDKITQRKDIKIETKNPKQKVSEGHQYLSGREFHRRL